MIATRKIPQQKKKPTAIKGNSEDVITHEQTKHVKRLISTRGVIEYTLFITKCTWTYIQLC